MADRIFNFAEGEIILIDKPLHWTSFDVVGKVRSLITKCTGNKGIKVGHTGTLDPLASGLVILCTGKFTKRIDELQGMQKEYLATIELGKTTPSFDLETEFDAFYPFDHITPEKIENAIGSFKGISEQIPPVFSAKKIQGKRAYEYARKGKDIALDSKQIEIFDIHTERIEIPYVTFQITCSKGTYIRSLARDIGLKLHCGAYLKSLCRMAIGNFHLSDAISLEKFEEILLKTKQTTNPIV